MLTLLTLQVPVIQTLVLMVTAPTMAIAPIPAPAPPISLAPTAILVSTLAVAEGRLEQHDIQLAFAIKTANTTKTGTGQHSIVSLQ